MELQKALGERESGREEGRREGRKEGRSREKERGREDGKGRGRIIFLRYIHLGNVKCRTLNPHMMFGHLLQQNTLQHFFVVFLFVCF